jgi:hypothetical protein
LTFRVLYCFFVIEHHRRRILHFNTTATLPASGSFSSCGSPFHCPARTVSSCSTTTANSVATSKPV